MSTLDLAAIRERARLCAYQEWEDAGYNYRFQEGEVVANSASVSVAIVDNPYDLEHIAGMDPATTLALCDEIDRLREEAMTAHNELVFLAMEISWATDGTLHTAVRHIKELVRRRNATIDRVREIERQMDEYAHRSGPCTGVNCGGCQAGRFSTALHRVLEGGELKP